MSMPKMPMAEHRCDTVFVVFILLRLQKESLPVNTVTHPLPLCCWLPMQRWVCISFLLPFYICVVQVNSADQVFFFWGGLGCQIMNRSSGRIHTTLGSLSLRCFLLLSIYIFKSFSSQRRTCWDCCSRSFPEGGSPSGEY